MKKSVFNVAVIVLLMAFLTGLCGTADAFILNGDGRLLDLTGSTWTGSARGATETGFFEAEMTLEITQQEDFAFYGLMVLGEGEAFPVSGVIMGGEIRMTAAASSYDGILVTSLRRPLEIQGRGSKFGTDTFPTSLTFVYRLTMCE